LAGDALEVERDANPIGGRRTEIVVELHVSSLCGHCLSACSASSTRFAAPAECAGNAHHANRDDALSQLLSRSLLSRSLLARSLLARSLLATSSAERRVSKFMARSKAGRSAGGTTSARRSMNSSALGANSS